MAFPGFLQGPDINRGYQDYLETAGGLLLDVRTPEEYTGGHLPGSKNVPLQVIPRGEPVAQELNTPIFVYCHSGARSRRAARLLQAMGYSDVRDIGGLVSYSGRLTR